MGRTGLAIAGFGVGIAKLAIFVHGLSPGVGIGLVVIASVILVASAWRFVRFVPVHRAAGRGA